MERQISDDIDFRMISTLVAAVRSSRPQARALGNEELRNLCIQAVRAGQTQNPQWLDDQLAIAWQRHQQALKEVQLPKTPEVAVIHPPVRMQEIGVFSPDPQEQPPETEPESSPKAEESQKIDPLSAIIPTSAKVIENQEQLLAVQETHLKWKESILNPKTQGIAGRACFKGLDLKHLNFSQLDFSYADFSESDAENVDFSAANLSRAIFNKSQLAGANFTAANLKKTSFMRASLGNADFTGANAETADFSWASGEYPDQLRRGKDSGETSVVSNDENGASTASNIH